jgi:hypothetical protein
VNDAGVIVGSLADPAGPNRHGHIFNAGTYAFRARRPATFARDQQHEPRNRIQPRRHHREFRGIHLRPVRLVVYRHLDPGSFLTIAQSMNTAGRCRQRGVARWRAGGCASRAARSRSSRSARCRRARGINDVGVIAGFVTVGASRASTRASSDFAGFEADGSRLTTRSESRSTTRARSRALPDGRGHRHTRLHRDAGLDADGTTSSSAYTFSVAVIPNSRSSSTRPSPWDTTTRSGRTTRRSPPCACRSASATASTGEIARVEGHSRRGQLSISARTVFPTA